MDLHNYQEQAMRTRGNYESKRDQLLCAGLGLTGEAGEVAELLKKKMFHMKEVKDEEIVKELGDTLWYLALVADCIGWDLSVIASLNIEKLKRRYPAGFTYQAANQRVDLR